MANLWLAWRQSWHGIWNAPRISLASARAIAHSAINARRASCPPQQASLIARAV